ncbi:hypothetical protein BH11PLA2_BH11PLA2_12570 [soil metagenome]
MLAPIPPPPARPATVPVTPPARLDVRLGGGRVVGYPLPPGDFLLGGGDGCDLRLPGDVPPVILQFQHTGEGLRVLHKAPQFNVSFNGAPLRDTAMLNHGDSLSVGPAEISVSRASGEHLIPKLVPIAEEAEQENAFRQSALDEQASELEADRRLWYARRQEMEAELEAMRQQLASTGQDRLEAVTRREREQAQLAEELTAVRQKLLDDYEAKRQDLATLHEQVLAASKGLEARKADFEEECDRRFEALHDEMEERRVAMEAEFEERRKANEERFAIHIRECEAEIARKRIAFEDDLREYEPRMVSLRLEREQTAATKHELLQQTTVLDGLRQDLARERLSLDAERQWQVERIEKREADLAGREADLARREEFWKADRVAFESERTSHKEDLVRLDRWQAALEARQATIDSRAAEVDTRFEQMKRDAADLEDQLHLANAEELRLHHESERLDRLRADIEVQAGKFAERSAQVEAQQAMLAVLRAKLDRQQDEVKKEMDTLAAERNRQAMQQEELSDKLRDLDMMRAELGFLRDDHEAKTRVVAEQQSLLGTTMDEFRRQKDEVLAAEAKLTDREADLDTRASEIAEQAATLKARLMQALELQQRLEADRVALREREAALAEAEQARQALQEQLRKRAEDLTHRNKSLDEIAREAAEERAVAESLRHGIDEIKARALTEVEAQRNELEAKAAELERQMATIAEREEALSRQVARMKEVGTSFADERKAFFETKQAWETDQAYARQQTLMNQQDAEAFRHKVAEHVAELRRQAPELEHRANGALEKLAGARDVLRGHLAELHAYAKQSRQDLEQARDALIAHGDTIRQREQTLEQSRSEHRLAITAFRQQLHDWQAKIGELKQGFALSDTKAAERNADLDRAAKRLDDAREDLTRQAAAMRDEHRVAIDKRNEMERHLADMREWYRRKLRDLAQGRSVDDSDIPAWDEGSKAELVSTVVTSEVPTTIRLPQSAGPPVLEDADAHLGKLLQERGLLDAATLSALAVESKRQRKTLRQVLLASGVLTVYQMALIEAGNLDGLVMGRLRVIDRIKATPREILFRVFDPNRPASACVLRVLADAESQDRVHAEEFTIRFNAATKVQHANLVNVLETLEIQGRPAVLQEAVNGVPSSDWPALAATPGVWLKLVLETAKGLNQCHKAGLVHGRLAPESVLLTGEGGVKIAGLGEPPWLTGGPVALFDPLPAADLRALGKVAYGWSQIGARRRVGKGKPFPTELSTIIRRLETGAELPMEDIVPIDRPFADTAELLRALTDLAGVFPCPSDVWTKLLNSLHDAGEEEPLRQSA